MALMLPHREHDVSPGPDVTRVTPGEHGGGLPLQLLLCGCPLTSTGTCGPVALTYSPLTRGYPVPLLTCGRITHSR
jgi:hypothetical protein